MAGVSVDLDMVGEGAVPAINLGASGLPGASLHLRVAPWADVLLVTLDTTRADRLGCYGYTAGQTPVLDALASAGVLCECASTVAPLTLPAHSSMFTGLYPIETGVRTNGRTEQTQR